MWLPMTATGATAWSLVADGCAVDGGLGATLHTQLGEQPGDIVFDRLLGQEQPITDLPVGEPVGDQAEDLPLPIGERRQPWISYRSLPQPGQQPFRHGRVEQRTAGRNLPHGINQGGPADLLEQITRRTTHDR